MDFLINKLSQLQELQPDKHDGSYELVRGVAAALKNIDINTAGIEDLDMLYFMTVGTWSYSYEKKKEIIKKSHLKPEDKERLIELIDKLKKNAENKLYENRNNDEPTIGMFGSGFNTYRASSIKVEDARTFLELCISINDLQDEEEILTRTDDFLKNRVTGMKTAVASISQILHCLKPDVFPILNKSNDAGVAVYKKLGMELKSPNKIYNFIDNVKTIRDFRNKYCNFKNYRVIDMLLWDDKKEERNYWWLNAKPSIWSFDNIDPGEIVNYTSHTDEGTKRKIYKYFDQAKIGDFVIGYDTTPTRAIVAICKVSKEHDGQIIEFQKIRKIENPVTLDAIKNIKQLGQMEPIHNRIGSFFKIKQSEFEAIMELIENKNGTKKEPLAPYNKRDLLQEVFISEEKYEDIIFDLEHKKNIIFQGPPGVGKTFIAKRIAYSHMGFKDNSKIQMIQFHQNYSYEDFIQGFRPTEDGRFKLKNGIFYEFCRRAQRDQEHNYYFIIDEINRGNLSKIFGELMMLVENDKRGKEFEIPLTYAQGEEDKFYIPDNLYLIGTMNTADRSLAMVDYALRRRFSFINIEPAFSTKAFNNYMKSKGIDESLINKITTVMERLNEKIGNDSKNLGKGYKIGHSYFCNIPVQWKSGESQEMWYRRIILSEIKPLLYEYWFDDEDTAEIEVNKLL